MFDQNIMFYHPYQLYNNASIIKEFDNITDEGKFDVKVDDIVVFGNDGLFDNVCS